MRGGVVIDLQDRVFKAQTLAFERKLLVWEHFDPCWDMLLLCRPRNNYVRPDQSGRVRHFERMSSVYSRWMSTRLIEKGGDWNAAISLRFTSALHPTIQAGQQTLALRPFHIHGNGTGVL